MARRLSHAAAIAAIALYPSSAAVAAPPIESPTPARAFRSFDRRVWRGLPQSTITALAQDRSGVLWIGTTEGAATFEGARMEPLRLPDRTSPGYIWSIRARAAGGVVMAATKGVFRFGGSAGIAVPELPGARAADESPDGTVWAVNRDGRVVTWSGRAGEIWLPLRGPTQASTEQVGPAIDLRVAPEGSVYVATGTEIWRVDRGQVSRLGGARLGAGDRITAMCVRLDGSVWAGLASGAVVSARTGTSGWRSELGGPSGSSSASRIRVLIEDRRNRLVAGSGDGRLLFRRSDGSWTTWDAQSGLKPAGIISLLADREGSLWVGHTGEGLHQWIGEAWSHRVMWLPLETPVATAFVDSINGTRNGFLAAVTFKGLWHWDGRQMRQYGRSMGLTEDVRCGVEPEPGVTWAGTRFGIFESRHGSNFSRQLTLPVGFVITIRQAPDGRWFAVTSQSGIFQFAGGKWVAAAEINRVLPTQMTRGIAWPVSGETWVSTNEGLTILGGGRVEQVSGAQVPAFENGASAAIRTADGAVWVAGESGLAVRTAGHWRSLTAADGLPGNVIHAVAESPDGSVWVGGPDGIARFSRGRWTSFDGSNGLINSECNLNGIYAAPDGSVYFGTAGSLARFDPTVDGLPLPTLACMWRDAPSLDATGVLRLPSSTRDVKLQWAAPWLLPETIEYRYRLWPDEQDWVRADQNTQLMINAIGPGSHRIEVQARVANERDHDWSTPLTMTVYGTPRFLESWPGFALALLAGAMVVGAAVRWRTRVLQRRHAELKAAVDDALSHVKTLQGLLPICAWCKRVRDDGGYWSQIESYLMQRVDANFTHSICPECMRTQGFDQRHEPVGPPPRDSDS